MTLGSVLANEFEIRNYYFYVIIHAAYWHRVKENMSVWDACKESVFELRWKSGMPSPLNLLYAAMILLYLPVEIKYK